MKSLALLSIAFIASFALTSCTPDTRTVVSYEGYYLIHKDSLSIVRKDSIVIVPVKQDSVMVNCLVQKNGLDTIRITGNVLKVSCFITKEGKRVEKSHLLFQLLNNRNEELASIRIIDEDSTEQLSHDGGRQTIVFSGRISAMPVPFARGFGEMDSLALNTVAPLKKLAEKKATR